MLHQKRIGLRCVSSQDTNQKPTTTMSYIYNESGAANAQTKCSSRAKIAFDIQKNTPFKGNATLQRVTHYLGGTSHRSPFEAFFNKGRSFFVRYEKLKCQSIPMGYCEAIWNENGLVPKQKNQHGYFINADFFHNCDSMLNAFPNHAHDMWLDFCGMPTDDLLFCLDKKVFNNIHSNKIRFVYLTFYMNPRGIESVRTKLDRYGKTLGERAKSLCEYMQEKYLTSAGFSCEVFDTYMNDVSPMAVLKLENQNQNQNQVKKITTTKDKSKNATNFATLRRYYTETEIQNMWGVPPMAIAAYKAWNTMRGTPLPPTHNTRGIEVDTIKI